MEIICRFESGFEFTKPQLEMWLRPLIEHERFVVAHRVGLIDGVSHTLQETGELFGKNREQVRRIEIRAFRKMRYASR